MTDYAAQYKITIAVMGCRVNGPGETDDADLGLWCGPTTVNLKKKDQKIGFFKYDEVLSHLRTELDKLIAERIANELKRRAAKHQGTEGEGAGLGRRQEQNHRLNLCYRSSKMRTLILSLGVRKGRCGRI